MQPTLTRETRRRIPLAMLGAFFLSIGQLGGKPIARVFLKSLGLTVLIFVAIGAALWLGGQWVVEHLFAASPWGGHLAGALAVLAAMLSAWLLFRAVAIAAIGIFGDEVVHAVEARHYPDALASARNVPLGRSLLMGIGSAARAIGINLLLAPLYLVLIVTGVGTAVLFFVVNAWLLGRDLGDMVAARHLDRDALPEWRGRTRLSRFALGAIGTALLLVPIVNLGAPVIAAAMATHLYHRRGRR